MALISELRLYQRAFEFSNKIWNICLGWKYFARRTIGEQIVKSSDSIPANIAEGYGRYNIRDNIRFCYYSRGSLEETKDWLEKSHIRNLTSDSVHKDLLAELEIISRELWNYIQSLKTKNNNCQPTTNKP
jgi:four helix bundle protein